MTGSADREIRLWVNYQCSKVFKGHTDCVRALAVVDRDRFLSGSNDAAIRLWSISRGETLNTFYGHTNFIYRSKELSKTPFFMSIYSEVTKKNFDLLVFPYFLMAKILSRLVRIAPLGFGMEVEAVASKSFIFQQQVRGRLRL